MRLEIPGDNGSIGIQHNKAFTLSENFHPIASVNNQFGERDPSRTI